jgi:hypothetical protein
MLSGSPGGEKDGGTDDFIDGGTNYLVLAFSVDDPAIKEI